MLCRRTGTGAGGNADMYHISKEQKENHVKQKMTAGRLVKIGFMAALLCILGPVSVAVPVSPVPISLGTLAVYLIVVTAGTADALLSCLVYFLLGFAGLPVFSGYMGGAGRLFGPTGGYLIGYLFLIMIAGAFTGRFHDKRKERLFSCMGLVLGTAVLYLFGTGWLAFISGMGFYEALWAGVIPFIPGDLVKMLAAVFLGMTLRGRLAQAGLSVGRHEKSH